jgi:hypothetical protein
MRIALERIMRAELDIQNAVTAAGSNLVCISFVAGVGSFKAAFPLELVMHLSPVISLPLLAKQT